MKRKLFTFLLAIVASIGLTRAEVYSGTCGAEGDGSNLTWTLNTEDSTLIISGVGAMENWSLSSSSTLAPWNSHYENVAYISIGEGITSIGELAFAYFYYLKSVTIPNSITHIGAGAFYNCRAITFITIPYGVNSIEYSTFEECWSLESITIPNTVTNIGNSAFERCESLTSIDIPNSVVSIGNSSFKYCFGLTSISIPNSVTTIGDNAFMSVFNVNYTGSAEGAPWGAKYINLHEDGYLLYEDATKSNLIKCYKTATGNIVLPNSVTNIEANAFQYCDNISSVTIQNNTTTIGENAFERVLNIEYSGSATGSPWGAKCVNGYVEGCFAYRDEAKTQLAGCMAGAKGSIAIPNSVISIDGYAFNFCSNIESITIGNNLSTIEDYAFNRCTALKAVYITNFDSWCQIEFNGLLSNPLYYAHHLYLNGEEVKKVVIPEGSTNVGNCAFAFGKYIDSVVIPNSVTRIGFYAFNNCESLSKLVIGKNVSYIGQQAFENCNITTVYATPPTPPTILSNTFRNISSSAIVYVPEQSLEAYLSAPYWQNLNLVGTTFSGAETSATSTSVSITTIQNVWELTNKYIASCSVEGGETFEGNILEFNGLEPETEYNKTIALTSNTGEMDTINVSFTTTALELTTQQPKIVSSSTAILLAETNMADAEVNCGFEWRRDNQPEAMASTKVYAPVANGVMAGRLKGLKDDVYYKYRAFYESSAGNKYYGDWQYIFTGDNTVEFDPVMYTYPAQAVTETTATLKGYALAGSDDFTEQGFEYWVVVRVIIQNGSNAPRHAYHSAIGEHMTVQASGISMKVTLTNLDEGSVYKYRSYAVVDGQKVYGEEQSFTTLGEYLYTVTFVDYDGAILGTDKVHYGTAATAPEDPTREGYNFVGWDNDFSNVTDDLTITATYSNATALNETTATECKAQKILRDGQILILRDGKTFTVQGQEVR